MTEMQVTFDEEETKHFETEMRRRGVANPQIGYDEAELNKLAANTHNAYKDKRLAFNENWPSLSIWALGANSENRLARQRVTKFVYETLGSMIFVWFVVFSVFMKIDIQQLTLGIPGFPILLSIQSLLTGFIQGFGLLLALVACGYFSAEFNSTYTLIVGFFPRPGGNGMGATLITALIKILGQHLGAFLGGLLALAVLGNSNFPGGGGTPPGFPGVPGNPLGFGFIATLYAPSTGQAWVFEMLGSMMLGLLMMIIQFNPASTLTRHPHLALPFTLVALVTFGCPITGAVFNWTRYFGHAIVAAIAGGSFGGLWWLFLTAPLVGHILAAILYLFVFRI